MTKPIALQLYSVRDALSADFEGTLRRVADIGFVGVEFAGNYGGTAEHAASVCRDLGLQISSAHFGLPSASNSTLADAAALGLQRIVCPWMPPDRFKTLESVRAVCDEINAGVDPAVQAGLQLGYHNHDAEFGRLEDGSLVFDHMLQFLRPEVFFEIDIYWVKYAGEDPASVLASLGSRAPLVHVKDGSGEAGSMMLAAGEGIVDIPAAVNAASGADWLIVELDNCATDMFEAIEKSAHYLIDKGLGHGR